MMSVIVYNPMFWRWLIKLDVVADDMFAIGNGINGQRPGSVVDDTGYETWKDLYLDGYSPRDAFNEAFHGAQAD